MRLPRSPLVVGGLIVAFVGLLIAALSAVEWRRQHQVDTALQSGGTRIVGTVAIVKSSSRDGTPAVVRVDYTFQGDRRAEVDVSTSPTRDSLTRGSRVDLLVADDEPSSPRLVQAVGGGDQGYWRNSTLGGVVVLVAGIAFMLIPALRNRNLGRSP